MSGRRCLICRAASPAECAGGMDPRRTFAEPCGPFVTPTLRELWGSAPEARHADEWDDLHPMHTPPALTRLAERQFVRINDPRTPRGVPAYHPTDAQPIRVGGPET